ncbi:MAG: HEAT repeat domain-containing protein [Nitrospirota bacterium]|nr:HEAT repeat domain-containing protein [Nitrospirota bacterium]
MSDYVDEQIAALKDEDWAVREDAASALGASRDARAVAPLVALLSDGDRAVRQAAIAALTAIGTAAVPALGACLAAPDLNVQESAASILSGLADDRVLDPLRVSLGSPDWIVRMHAAKALGRIGDPGSVDLLMPLLQDKVKAVRVDAAQALVAIGQPAVPHLLVALKHEEWVVRLHAVEALGWLKSSESVETLLWLLFNDQDQAIREDAVRALGEIGDARAVDFLFLAMKDVGLRHLAIEALGKIGDRRAVPALVDVVTGVNRPADSRKIDGCGDRWDTEMHAMEAAVRALALIREEATIPTLVGALQHTVVRAEAAAALVSFGPPAIPFLLGVLKQERDDNILFYAKDTLAQLGWRANRIQ